MVLEDSERPAATVDDTDGDEEEAQAAADAGLIAAEERMARRGVWRAVIANSGLVGLWYLFSISITVVSPFPLPRTREPQLGGVDGG
jgi:hypothetical protein